MRQAILFLMLCIGALSARADWHPELEFRFQNGDRIEVGVYRSGNKPEVILQTTLSLDGGGQATLENGRRVKIGFGNVKSAMAVVESGFRTGNDLIGLNVEAQILRHNGRPIVTLLGEVKTPGHGEWTPGMSLADLLARAGGFSPGAYKKRVIVQRTGNISYIDCRQDQTAKDFKMEIGDVVTVELATLQL